MHTTIHTLQDNMQNHALVKTNHVDSFAYIVTVAYEKAGGAGQKPIIAEF